MVFMKTRSLIYIFFVAALVVLSACNVAPTPTTLTPTPPLTQTPAITETPRPSATLVPSYTALPPSPTATITPSFTPTLTATLTPQPVFAGFQVEYAQLTYYGMLMAFRIPGIKVNYRLTIGGVDYPCDLNDKSPDHLYCHGPQLKNGQSAKLVFLPLKGDNTPVYETTYLVTLLNTATVSPDMLATLGGDKCAVRGVHVTCETEYRNDGKGGYCIVATCVDLCGYYYSVHTCPEGSENWGIYPMTGTPPLPGNR
jgi:hypothetical protein